MDRPGEQGLNEVEENRYARQIVLRDIGWKGQVKLKHSTVLVAGAGGLGSPILIQLASLGVGTIKIVDRDIVSLTDLHRQYLYRESDAGRPKAEVAVKRIHDINGSVKVEGYAESLSYESLLGELDDVDVALDGLDDMKGRYALNRAAYRKRVPYVFASALEMYGNVSTIIPGKTPCLECFLGGVSDASTQKCAVVGVHPSLLGLISSVSVSEAVKILTGGEPSLASKLLLIDLRHFSFNSFDVSANPSCPVSGNGTNLSDIRPALIERACARDGSGTYFVNPPRALELPLERLDRYAAGKGYSVKASGDLFITMKLDNLFDVSVLRSGAAMFKVKKPVADIEATEKRIEKVFRSLVEDGLSVSWDSYSSQQARPSAAA